MQPGVSFPSYRDGAVWTGTGWSTPYPVTNVGDCVYLSNVARASAAGHVTLSFVLPAAEPVQMLALANHNLTAADTFRIRLFSGAVPNPGSFTPVADTGTGLVFPFPSAPLLKPDGTPRYTQTTPMVMSTPVSVQSGLIDITTTTVLAEVGGIEIAGWWAWRGISFGLETGIDSRETEVQLAGGADFYPREWSARQKNGQIDFIVLGPTGADLAMDFEQQVDITRPFCFVEDTGDSTTWPRSAMMMTQTAANPLIGQATKFDQFQFKFNEHMR